MKVRDMEKLAALLGEFIRDVAGKPQAPTLEGARTMVESEVYELKRRGKRESPKRAKEL